MKSKNKGHEFDQLYCSIKEKNDFTYLEREITEGYFCVL